MMMNVEQSQMTEKPKKNSITIFSKKRRTSPKNSDYSKVNLINQGVAPPNSEKQKYKKKFLSRSLV